MSIHLRGKDGTETTIDARLQGRKWIVDDGETRREVEVLEHEGARISFTIDGIVHCAHVHVGAREVRVVRNGRESVFQRQARAGGSSAGLGAETNEPVLRAPVPGRVLKVDVVAGAAVQTGDVLVVIEAMKMETPIVAPADGTVVEVHVEGGALVEQDQAVVTLGY